MKEVDMSSTRPAAAFAETDLAEINTATKQRFAQQLRVLTDIECILGSREINLIIYMNKKCFLDLI